jgi:hypothetical protein
MTTPTTGLEGVRYALTLWRPWAACVVVGPKDTENRRWAPPKWIMGQRIAIHAGKVHDGDAEIWIGLRLEALGLTYDPDPAIEDAVGAIIGTARVVGVHAPTSLLDPRETSPWHMREQYGWILAERMPLPKPIAARGAQKLWLIPEELRMKASR